MRAVRNERFTSRIRAVRKKRRPHFGGDAEVLNHAAWFFATNKPQSRIAAKALDYANRALGPADPAWRPRMTAGLLKTGPGRVCCVAKKVAAN